jgi:hypothetical protein
MIDRSTRWLEAVPLKDTSATSCADTFVATWVARFGVPECIFGSWAAIYMGGLVLPVFQTGDF